MTRTTRLLIAAGRPIDYTQPPATLHLVASRESGLFYRLDHAKVP